MRNPNHKRKPKHSKVKYRVVELFDMYLMECRCYVKFIKIDCKKKSYTSSVNSLIGENNIYKFNKLKKSIMYIK